MKLLNFFSSSDGVPRLGAEQHEVGPPADSRVHAVFNNDFSPEERETSFFISMRNDRFL